MWGDGVYVYAAPFPEGWALRPLGPQPITIDVMLGDKPDAAAQASGEPDAAALRKMLAEARAEAIATQRALVEAQAAIRVLGEAIKALTVKQP